MGRIDRAVVLAERLHLGRQLGIEPVGMRHGRLEVVDDQRSRHAAEMPEGVFQAAQKVIGRLRKGGLAVALAAVAENDAKDVRLAPLAVGRRSAAHRCRNRPGLLRRADALHAAEGQRSDAAQAAHVPPQGVVMDRDAFGGQVLVDPLDGQPGIELGQDAVTVRLTLTGRAACSVSSRSARSTGSGTPVSAEEPVGAVSCGF